MKKPRTVSSVTGKRLVLPMHLKSFTTVNYYFST
uniref:Uncharacterized protein n=1 Tax=Anopheles quadriannulatus TaxID=34691 RepID=A0A182XU49_ANOQN